MTSEAEEGYCSTNHVKNAVQSILFKTPSLRCSSRNNSQRMQSYGFFSTYTSFSRIFLYFYRIFSFFVIQRSQSSYKPRLTFYRIIENKKSCNSFRNRNFSFTHSLAQIHHALYSLQRSVLNPNSYRSLLRPNTSGPPNRPIAALLRPNPYSGFAASSFLFLIIPTNIFASS